MRDDDRWPTAGDTMTFLGENGYDQQLEAAKKVFEVGKSYEVESCRVEDWSHSVRFVGIPGGYNGVMFSLDPTPPIGG